MAHICQYLRLAESAHYKLQPTTLNTTRSRTCHCERCSYAVKYIYYILLYYTKKYASFFINPAGTTECPSNAKWEGEMTYILRSILYFSPIDAVFVVQRSNKVED